MQVANQRHLGGIDHRAAADGDDEIRGRLARGAHRGVYRSARRMGAHLRQQADAARAERVADAAEKLLLACKRRVAQHKHAPRTAALGFRRHRLRGGLAKDDALLFAAPMRVGFYRRFFAFLRNGDLTAIFFPCSSRSMLTALPK
jgi:hypothetical protein